MSLAEKINELTKELSEEKQREIIDFIEFLKQKQLKEDIYIIDTILEENKEAMEELAK